MTSSSKMLRRTDVTELTGLSCSSIYRLMRKGLFPEPLRVGVRAVRWRSEEVYSWLESRPRATGEVGGGYNNAASKLR